MQDRGVNLSIMYVIVDRAVWSTEAIILSITYYYLFFRNNNDQYLNPY
jgi:hypothetical protein